MVWSAGGLQNQNGAGNLVFAQYLNTDRMSSRGNQVISGVDLVPDTGGVSLMVDIGVTGNIFANDASNVVSATTLGTAADLTTTQGLLTSGQAIFILFTVDSAGTLNHTGAAGDGGDGTSVAAVAGQQVPPEVTEEETAIALVTLTFGDTTIDTVDIEDWRSFTPSSTIHGDNDEAFYGSDADSFIRHTGARLEITNNTGDFVFTNSAAGGDVEFNAERFLFFDAINTISFRDKGNSNEVMFALNSSTLAIGSSSVAIDTTFNGFIDIIEATSALDIRIADTTTNATNKFGRIGGRHFTNAEQDILAIDIRSLSGASAINYGGGSSAFNAVEAHNFFTAADDITLTGTIALTLDSSQNASFPNGTISQSDTNGGALVQGISLTNTSAVANSSVSVLFNVFTQQGQIEVERTAADNGTDMIFYVDNTSGALTERFRLIEDGTALIATGLKIGAGVRDEILHIEGTTPILKIEAASAGVATLRLTSAGNQNWDIQTSATGLEFSANDAGVIPLILGEDGSWTLQNQGAGSDPVFSSNSTIQLLSIAGTLIVTNNYRVNDNFSYLLGTSNDASITYDGSNMLINPQAVGSGHVHFTAGNVGIGIIPEEIFHVSTSTNVVTALLESTAAGDTNVGPILDLHRNNAAGDPTDRLGNLRFIGQSVTGVDRTYAEIRTEISTSGNTTEDGIMELRTMLNGTSTTAITITGGVGVLVTPDIELDGALNHDGSTVGFYGVTPVARPAAYTRTATVVETRILNANVSATALNNNAVLAQLLEDLVNIGILQF